MASSGAIHPEPPEDGSDGTDHLAALFDPVLFDSLDLAQPPDAQLGAILRQLVPDVAPETAQSRAARIAIDRRIVARCAREDFEGPNTKKLLVVAFEYATPVIGFLVGTGRVFSEAERLGRPVVRQPGDEMWSARDRAELAEQCVDLGVFHVFHKHGLKKGRWDYRRGTALTTYAVNACSLSFATVYPRWWRGRVMESSFAGLDLDLPMHLQIDRHEPDPAERVANRLDAENLLLQMPEPIQVAMWLRAMEDETQAQAAAHLGLSEKALESRIGRARGKLGLTRTGPIPTPAPDPDPELDTQEGDRDR